MSGFRYTYTAGGDVTQTLIACEECDLLYHRISLDTGFFARCARCGATLFRPRAFRIETLLALTLAGLVVFLIANAFPIVTLVIKSRHHGSTLPGAIVALYREGMPLVSGLVLTTAILFPLMELAALLYLFIPLRDGRWPAHFHLVTRAIQAIRPWGMIEVFMLGILVALVKLSSLADIVPGVALWAFGALTVLLAAILMVDARYLWDLAEQCAGRHSS